MKNDKRDIVMFPKWKTNLEKDGLAAIKEKKYKEALDYFDKLSEFGVASNEVLTGKVICYMELGRYDEAIHICKELMKDDEENYYKYLHIYLTILLQTSQYEELIDLLDEIFKTESIPQDFRQQFWQLYEFSRKFLNEQKEDEENESIRHFIHSLSENDFHVQWRMLSRLRKSDVTPYLEKLKPFLVDESISPIVKTGMMQWFHEQGIDHNLEIEKFNKHKIINPIKLNDIMEIPYTKEVILLLDDIEQQNPTLFEFIKQLLYRYFYVYFPLLPDEGKQVELAQAVLELGMAYLQIEEEIEVTTAPIDKKVVASFKEEIEHLEVTYFAQLEE